MPTFSQKLRLMARVLAVEPLPPDRAAADGLPPGAKALTVQWRATTEDRGRESVEVDSGVARLMFPGDELVVSHTQEISVPSSRPPRPAQAEAELLLDYLARHIFDLRWTPVVTRDEDLTFVRPAGMRLCPEDQRAGVHDVEAFMAELRRMAAEELREGWR